MLRCSFISILQYTLQTYGSVAVLPAFVSRKHGPVFDRDRSQITPATPLLRVLNGPPSPRRRETRRLGRCALSPTRRRERRAVGSDSHLSNTSGGKSAAKVGFQLTASRYLSAQTLILLSSCAAVVVLAVLYFPRRTPGSLYENTNGKWCFSEVLFGICQCRVKE